MEGQICRPSYKEEDNYISKGIRILTISNANFAILSIIAISWCLFVTIGIAGFVNLKHKILCSFDDKLALGFAASIFVAIIISISKDKFGKRNFCLMNQNDPICINENNDCFDKVVDSNDLVSGYDFGHGKFIHFTSSIESENQEIGIKYYKINVTYFHFYSNFQTSKVFNVHYQQITFTLKN